MAPLAISLGHFTLTTVADGTQTVQCAHCTHKPFFYSGGTGSLIKHLAQQHTKEHAAYMSAVESQSVQSASSAVSLKRTAAAASLSSSSSGHSAAAAGKKPMLATSSPLVAAFSAAGNQKLKKAFALCFATCRLPHSLLSAPTFLALVKAIRVSTIAPPHRHAIAGDMGALAAELRERLWERMRNASSPVAIAIDGWTNVQQTKVTNILLISGGVAYYWCSINNHSSTNSAEWLSEAMLPKLAELHAGGVRFSAFIADNESVNGKLFKLLQETYPFLIRIPCAAHTIQLIAKRVMLCDRWEIARSGMTALLEYFSSNKAARLKLQNLQSVHVMPGDRTYALVKPNSTRWNSQLYAAERLLLLKDCIDMCLKQTDRFWADLKLYIEFLHPFQIATDIVQQDRSTLYDIFQQWSMLSQHSNTIEDADLKRQLKLALQQRWKSQVNEAATLASALLSLDIDLVEAGISPEKIDQARRFISSYGAQYLHFFKLSSLSIEELEGKLLLQCAQFTDRSERFQPLNDDIRVTKKSAGDSWSAHNVWALYTIELSVIARALLSMPASEAAVERSFSAQGHIHTKLRNSLHDASVQTEMFISFNYHPLHGVAPPRQQASFTELSVEFVEDSVIDSDAETDTELQDEVAEFSDAEGEPEPEEMKVECAAAALRTQSEINEGNRAFLEKYIQDNEITLATRWSANKIAHLEGAALLLNSGGYSTEQLKTQIIGILRAALL